MQGVNDTILQTDKALVSVIVPNYNHEKFLQQRLESILNQTYPNIEVIILDDKSTDDSISIINHFKTNQKVKHIIINEKNSGSPFFQWKRGIDLARGEWVWIAESDDYADVLFLETLLHAALNTRNTGLAYCDSRVVENSHPSNVFFADLKNKKLGTNRWSINHSEDGLKEIENYLLPYGTINNTSATLFRRENLVNANPFDIDLRYLGDKYTFIKILAKSNIVYVAKPLSYYRNPFDNKHIDKSISFFKEHFLIFNWVARNIKLDRHKFIRSVFLNAQISFFSNIDTGKLHLFRKLFWLNPLLFLITVLTNLYRIIFYRPFQRN